ncbi:MAG: glycosyltransferase family 39 protein [Methanophagales archaeon]|nr:glycosyltransferase family 39 protein [Methanophagales archaeon]
MKKNIGGDEMLHGNKKLGRDRVIKIIRETIPLIFILVSAIIVIFHNIGGSLADWDESIYAEVSKEILIYRDWITLHWNYSLWFHKPPLYMWLTAIMYKLVGVNEFSARFWSAIFGIGGIVITYFLGKELYNKYVGLISSTILLTTPQYLNYSRMGMLDVPITFFIALSILLFWSGLKNSKYFILSGISVGFAIMTKGVVGLLPFFIVLLFLVLTNLSPLKNKNMLKGLIASIAVAAPWHISQLTLQGKKFFDNYFMYHVIKRSEQAIEGHVGTDFYYFDILKKGFYPYSLFILFAVLYNAKTAFEEKKKEDILILSWIGVVLGVFTLAQTKLPWYIIPIYPALSISVAHFFYKFIDIEKRDGLIFGGMFIGFVLWISSLFIITHSPIHSKLIGGVIICIILFLVDKMIRHQKLFNNVIIKKSILILLVGVLLISTIHLPYVLDYNPNTKAVAQNMKIVSTPNDTLYLYAISSPAPLFYSDRKVSGINDENRLKQIFNDTKTVFVLIKTDDVANIGVNYKIISKAGNIMLITNNIRTPTTYTYIDSLSLHG